ncbi:MAG TPA: spore coat U domain-containing protein [Candidatus Acidoferrales bacterium]|jgi:spore coat protein U-like protein|nr:spore coat U domain-containing protein [Candidatus Acidoferrales bacterium]
MHFHLLVAFATLVAGVPPAHIPLHGGLNPDVRRPHATSCTMGALVMSFGAYAPLAANLSTPLSATGSVKMVCTFGGAYTLTAGSGANAAHASGSCAVSACTRALAIGTSYVSYDLYTSAAHTTVWNAANGISAVGDSLIQTISIFGYIPPGDANTAGTYTDTVTVTATF